MRPDPSKMPCPYECGFHLPLQVEVVGSEVTVYFDETDVKGFEIHLRCCSRNPSRDLVI